MMAGILKFFSAISKNNYRSLQLAIYEFAEQSNLSKDDLIEILRTFPSIVEKYHECRTVESKNEKITWYQYEDAIWAIGESFRHILIRNKQFRQKPEIINAIKDTVLNTTFGKGRQSFVMLFGYIRGNREIVDILQFLLEDHEVQGHAIYALRKLGIAEAQEDIRPFLKFPTTWIRNEAKKYFLKIQEGETHVKNRLDHAGN